MQKSYAKYSKKIEKFREEIYFYCDYNIGSDVLLPAFVNLWPENKEEKRTIAKRDLVVITSNILKELVNQRVLRVVYKENPSVYAFYRVRKHDFLLNHTSFIDKQKSLKFK